MLALAATAKMFAARPSALLGIQDPVLALSFDMAAMVRLRQAAAAEPARHEIEGDMVF